MKRIMIVAGLFGSLLATQARAQAPVPVTMLKGPVPDSAFLVISAVGSVRTPPDKVSLTIIINGVGDTDVAAKAQVAAKAEQLRTALIALGVDPSGISAPSVFSQMGFVGNEAYDPDDGPSVATALTALAKRRTAISTMRVRLTRGDMLPRVQKVVADLGLRSLSPPVLELKDDSTAHRAAIADAILKAKADADTYAAAIGYHVVRITQIANQMPAQKANEDGAAFIRIMGEAQFGEVRDVETNAVVTISFIIALR